MLVMYKVFKQQKKNYIDKQKFGLKSLKTKIIYKSPSIILKKYHFSHRRFLRMK